MDLQKGLEAMQKLADSLKQNKSVKKKVLQEQEQPWEKLSDEDWECFCYEVDCLYESELRKDKGYVKTYKEVEEEVWERWERKR